MSKGRRDATLAELSDDSLSSEDTSWISWYCSLRGNEFFCEVDEDYIQDDFNLTGLSTMVPNYEYALDMILDVETDDGLTEEQQEMIESAAEALYGLIHARFILTSRGTALMVDKFNQVDFGRCPRVFCHGQPVLPVGQSDIPRTNTARIFCPKCQDIYYPKYSRHANIDGAYFGTTFPHLLLQTYPELVVARPSQRYTPRIFGFKIHKPRNNNNNNNNNNNSNSNSTPDDAVPTVDHTTTAAEQTRQSGGASSPKPTTTPNGVAVATTTATANAATVTSNANL